MRNRRCIVNYLAHELKAFLSATTNDDDADDVDDDGAGGRMY